MQRTVYFVGISLALAFCQKASYEGNSVLLSSTTTTWWNAISRAHLAMKIDIATDIEKIYWAVN